MVVRAISPKKIFYRLVAFLSLLSVFALADFAYPQSFPVPDGSRCAECGMVVDRNSKFIAGVVTTDGKSLLFCDVGDMLMHFSKDRTKLKTVSVKDYQRGEWIDGKKAFYILNRKFVTPMSWSIAAFGDKSEAEKAGSPVDFNGAFRLLK